MVPARVYFDNSLISSSSVSISRPNSSLIPIQREAVINQKLIFISNQNKIGIKLQKVFNMSPVYL